MEAAFVEHAIAHRGADPEAFAFGGAHHQFAIFDGHQDAARRADGFDRQAHDHVEQFGQRGGMLRQLPAGLQQGTNLQAVFHLSLLAQNAGQAGHRGGGADGRPLSINTTVRSRAGVDFSSARTRCTRWPAVMRSLSCQGVRSADADAVHQGAVLAAQSRTVQPSPSAPTARCWRDSPASSG